MKILIDCDNFVAECEAHQVNHKWKVFFVDVVAEDECLNTAVDLLRTTLNDL